MADRTKVILVAEDHPVNQRVMKLLLNSLSVECEIVPDGAAALNAAKLNHYAAILMDIMMPELDGFQTAFHIRKHEFGAARRTPIIACTALDANSIADECIRAGIDDFLGKPVSKTVLKQKLERWTNLAIAPHSVPAKTKQRIQSMQKAAAKEDAPLDKAYVQLVYGTEQLDDILVLFLSVTRSLLGQLDAAILHEDGAVVARMAHEIKGSSEAITAREMAILCLELERAGQENNWPEAVKIYSGLGLAFARVQEFIESRARLIDEIQKAS